jgi:hypothetical protein
MSVRELVTDPRIAAAVASGTVGTGTIIDFIPDGIGKIATVIGIVLSLLLIRVHYVNLQKSRLELEIMKRKEEERLEAATARKTDGMPLRRGDD